MRQGMSLGVFAGVVLWGAACAWADESDGKTLVQQAYEKTRNAAAVEDFTEILDLCTEAENYELADDHATYVTRLKSWAHNKRGEAYTDLAASKLQSGDGAAAEEYDAAALEDFELAVELAPDRWKPLQNRAVAYALAGRYEKAVADFSRVIELHPEHANAWFNRAELRYELGRYNEAVVDYTESLARTPDDFGALTGRGHANYQAGRYRDALDDYDAAIRLEPEHSDAHANRGDAYLRLGQWELAARDYRRSMRLDPDSARAFRCAAWLMATCPDARFRDSEFAVQAAEKAFDYATDSLDAAAFDTLAAAYANAGQFDKARRTLERGIEIASADQRREMQQRLEMYSSEQPFRESTDDLTRTVSTGAARVTR